MTRLHAHKNLESRLTADDNQFSYTLGHVIQECLTTDFAAGWGGARDEIGDVAPTVCVYQYTSLHHIKSKKWGCPTLEGLYSAPTLEYPRPHPTTPCSWINALQRLKYNFNKYLAIANRSRVSCAHNTSKSRLRVTQGHWKRNHWVHHTRLTISRVT